MARFCVDTVLLVIDYLHALVFGEPGFARWLKLPRDAAGALVLKEATAQERMLRIPAG